LVSLRRRAYQGGWLRTERLPVPLVVVGNITAGGSGKTPLVVALAQAFEATGLRVGIVSRGYGGSAGGRPRRVEADSDPALCGDEPVLIARRTGCPVYVHPDRVAAAECLLQEVRVNLLLADDGLQHYRLGRDLEIAVIDGRFRLGNAWPLPAGPLREPAGRLSQVDFVICNGGHPRLGEIPMRLVGDSARALRDATESPLEAFRAGPVHAVAAIADPERFFTFLQARGLRVIPHAFSDHHQFAREDLTFASPAPVLMTEKDAVKCGRWPDLDLWYLPVTAALPDSFVTELVRQLSAIDVDSAGGCESASVSASGDA
jgi:tetraacyldisaccharide 4'-kinase